MQNKFNELKKYLTELNERGICLAFSGGIDSTLLLYLCKDLDVVAVTFKSDFQTKSEIDLTTDLCKKYGVEQEIIKFYPLENPVILNNPKDRCYYCKKTFFPKLKDFAGGRAIIDGTNFDDLGVYRPGLKALKELDIISPLAKFGITKKEIRDYAKNLEIEIFDKPSTPCLATRFPYGTKLSTQLLQTVEQGEIILKEFGFLNNRLRIHNEIARIEIPQEDFKKFIEQHETIIKSLKSLGLKYISLDIEGLRSGSMDLF
ncbi:MAG: ATP-dependent sacrificial sulfur transferase LarE [Candidatus Gastranaerophilales bacterium]|nr:ATP-dependent sacrificial sulfur transferase LarE [Candidatus Gastranaerophilales bacterium]